RAVRRLAGGGRRRTCGGDHVDGQADPAQELEAARRGGREDQGSAHRTPDGTAGAAPRTARRVRRGAAARRAGAASRSARRIGYDRSMPCRGLSAALCAALVLAGSGCSCGGESPAADAGASDGDGPRPSDASIGPDAAAPLIWIDFSITGCDSGSGGEPGGDGPPGGGADAGAEEPCRGAAPLVLQFVPVAPAPV